MKTTKTLLFPTFAALVLVSTFAVPAHAIPAFARKYNLSCTTCHAPAPRLKAYGEDFAGNGFRLPDGEEPRRAYQDTGDPDLLLQRDVPLAVRFDAYGVYETRDDEDVADLQVPWGIKLLSGGSVMEDVGYYVYFYMAEKGDVAGVEDAYLHFNDLGGLPLDVMVGQFQISDPMMKRELRLTFEDYQIYRVRPGGSIANLTYDRGVMVTYDTPVGLSFVGEVVNGNGLAAAEDGENDFFDRDPDKGYLGRSVYAAGPVTAAGTYYATKETLRAGGDAFENDVEVFGPDVHVGFDKVAASVQYMRRTDSDATGSDLEIETDGLIAELTIQPAGQDGVDAIVLLYNWIDSDDDASDYETITASWSRLHARNLRMVAELTYDLEIQETRAVVGFTAAF